MVIWADPAKSDLRAIHDFIASDSKYDEPVKSHHRVIPAEAGIQNSLILLDSDFHRNDESEEK